MRANQYSEFMRSGQKQQLTNLKWSFWGWFSVLNSWRWGNCQFFTGFHPRQSRRSFWHGFKVALDIAGFINPQSSHIWGVSLRIGIITDKSPLFLMPFLKKSRLDITGASRHTCVGKSNVLLLTINFTKTYLFYRALPVEGASTRPNLTFQDSKCETSRKKVERKLWHPP